MLNNFIRAVIFNGALILFSLVSIFILGFVYIILLRFLWDSSSDILLLLVLTGVPVIFFIGVTTLLIRIIEFLIFEIGMFINKKNPFLAVVYAIFSIIIVCCAVIFGFNYENPKDMVYSGINFVMGKSNKMNFNYEYNEQENYDGSYDYSTQDSGGGYHYTDGYTRSDGTEVGGYISGNPDGIESNNIEYMRDNGDYDGLKNAYDSVR